MCRHFSLASKNTSTPVEEKIFTYCFILVELYLRPVCSQVVRREKITKPNISQRPRNWYFFMYRYRFFLNFKAHAERKNTITEAYKRCIISKIMNARFVSHESRKSLRQLWFKTEILKPALIVLSELHNHRRKVQSISGSYTICRWTKHDLDVLRGLKFISRILLVY